MTEGGWSGTAGPDRHGEAPIGGRGWATGTQFGGRYAVGRLIGEGGWAETYEGQDLLLGRTVAIKILRTQFAADPALVDRFEREARISASISHPNVVTVYDYGTENGSFFIALQFIAGEDLKQTIVRRGRIPVPEAIQITREILRGLAEIHRAGIVHRDVKPQNVLMGNDGLIRITDFGIAHQELATRVTTHGDALGTAAYMAPEQAQGTDVFPETDIYAVGIVLFELLTGRLPFNRGHAMAILLAHVQQPPIAPSAAAPDAAIAPWLDAVVLRALAKSPADRFPSAAAMGAALGAPHSGTAITAPMRDAHLRTTTTAGRVAPGPSQPPWRDGSATLPSRALGRVGAAGGGATPPAPPTARDARDDAGSSRSLRLAASVLVGIMVIALIGIALASVTDGDGLGLWGGNDGDSATATVRSIPALPTATEAEPDEPTEPTATVSAPTERTNPTVVPQATFPLRTLPSEAPRPTATTAPPPTDTPSPTEPPDPTDTPQPTETPVPTDTPQPTETPFQTDTPVPVEEEPTEPPAAPTSRSGVIVGTDDRGTGGADADADANAGSALVELAATSWSGGVGIRTDDAPPVAESPGDAREVMEIDSTSDADSVATANFELENVPDSGIVVEIQVRLVDGETNPGELSVSVNDANMPEPADLSRGGSRWWSVRVTVPADALFIGSNQIVATVSDTSGPSDGRATILLGDITVSAAEETAGASSSGSASTEIDTSTEDGPDFDTTAPPEGDEVSEPTIAPI